MKANAPEKIYLQENTTTDLYEEWWPEWFFARAKDTDVEYTRTDAFIKKAEKYIRSVADGLDRDDDVEAFINKFKKYMKEE